MSPVLMAVVGVILALAFYGTVKRPRMTSVLFWSVVATIFLGTALILMLPFPFREQAMWVALSTPLIWVCFQFWCYWDAKQWRVTLGLISITFISMTVVLLSDSPV